MGRLRVLDTDPVQFLISWLHEHLGHHLTVGDSREGPELPYVSVRSDGGVPSLPWTMSSGMAVNIWAATEKEAQDLALEVRSWIEYATHSVLCQLAEASMPHKVSEDGKPQRFLTAQITLSQRLP